MITTKEQFKKVILQALNENLIVNDCRGHWIGPDGTVIDVNYSHEVTAIEAIKNLLKRGKITQEEYDTLRIPLNSTTEVENFLYSRGWLRGVKDSEDEYYANGGRNQQPTPKQTTWLRRYGQDFNRNVSFLPKGEGINQRGIKFIHHKGDVMQEDLVPVKPVTPEQEKMAKFFIFNVWRKMPVEDRFSPYQFSMWMDNERYLQDMKMRIANQIFPNDDEAGYKFFDDIIVPTLEKLEDKFYARRAKKIDANDPLFILKSIIRGKSYRVAKAALYKATQNKAWKGGYEVTDDMVNALFQRQYRLFMGETMFDFNTVKKDPYLSELKNPGKSQTESLFVQHYAGWKSEKFPDMVKVWRGTNSPINKIRPGDFLTFDRDFAEGFVTGKFGAVIKDILPSKDLRVYKMEIDNSELVYWPEGHTIKKFTGKVPTFHEFWEENR